MEKQDYLRLLVDEIHSVVLATVDEQNHPATRVIDMMYQDGQTVYFLTANTKPFYKQLINNPHVSITGLTAGESTMDRKMISLKGIVSLLRKEKLDILMERNPYMYDIYPTEESRNTLEVFTFTEAEGQFYDLTVLPPRIETFTID